MDHFTPFQSLTASHFVFHATVKIIWGVNDIRVCDKHTHYTFKQKKGQRWRVQIALGAMPGAPKQSICGMRVCLLVELRPGEETDNVRSAGTIAACPKQRARLTVGGLGAPLGQQRPLHRSPPSASFPPFTCSLVALLWLLLRRKRPNSRLTTRTRTGQRKPHRNIHLLMVYFWYYLLCLQNYYVFEFIQEQNTIVCCSVLLWICLELLSFAKIEQYCLNTVSKM